MFHNLFFFRQFLYFYQSILKDRFINLFNRLYYEKKEGAWLPGNRQVQIKGLLHAFYGLWFVFSGIFASTGTLHYQAVVRGADRLPLPGQDVHFRFSILDAAEYVLFTETQMAVTGELGTVAIPVGETDPAALNALPWWEGPMFLKIEADLTGGSEFQLFDVQPMHSVPYAHFSGTTGSFAPGKLYVTGKEDHPDGEALFEVKRNDGQTVFAVFPDGVRVYVDTTAGKGTKGGFAVGGFTPGKAGGEEYLWVSPDSVRIYIEDEVSKASKGGFAVGGFNPAKGSNREFFRVTDDSTRIYVDTGEEKGPKGGFAVGGFTPGKFPVKSFMELTPENYFIGESAGANNTGGMYNAFIGYRAGTSNTVGNHNIFIGYESGNSNIDGEYNMAVGHQAGYSNLGPMEGYTGGGYGSYNSYLGYMAGYSGTNSAHNTFVGFCSGKSNQSDNNTFIGSLAGSNNISGWSNTFVGTESGRFNTTGMNNTFLGRWAGWNVEDGHSNTFLGTYAGADLKSGSENVVIGSDAMADVYYGPEGMASQNVIIGTGAGKKAMNSLGNVFIGFQAGYEETGSNLLYIANSSTVTPLVYGNFESTLFRINGDIEYTGTLTEFSDLRLKTNIIPLTGVMEKLLQIKGIRFDWNSDINTGLLLMPGRHIGVIAQEVEQVFPELVKTSDRGYKMVDYVKLTPLLLEAIREQQAMIDELERRVEALENGG